MLEIKFRYYLCRLLALLILTGFSVVVSAAYYTLEGEAVYERSPQVASPTELQKLFTYKATLVPENDYTGNKFGEEVNVSVSALDNDEKQYMEVTAKGIKWTATVHEHKVKNFEHIANDESVNSGLVSAGLNFPIRSLMKNIYRRCLGVHETAIRANWLKPVSLRHVSDFEYNESYPSSKYGI